MVPDLRRGLAQYLTSAGHLLLLAIAWQFQERSVWLICLGLVAGISASAWLANLRRYRAISDTATARISSAAQGFVELSGQGKALPGERLLSPPTLLPCLWYRFKCYQRRHDKWVLTDRGESEQEFLLDDGSGQCLLRPYDAEILCDRKDTYHQGDMKYVVETLLAGDRLHVLGQFVSRGGSRTRFDKRAELNDLLTEWKRQPDELKRRFDSDRNGSLDADEWAAAVSVARQEVANKQDQAYASPALHSLDRPGHGQPYLIASHEPAAFANHYRYWAWGHAAIMGAALAAIVCLPP